MNEIIWDSEKKLWEDKSILVDIFKFFTWNLAFPWGWTIKLASSYAFFIYDLLTKSEITLSSNKGKIDAKVEDYDKEQFLTLNAGLCCQVALLCLLFSYENPISDIFKEEKLQRENPVCEKVEKDTKDFVLKIVEPKDSIWKITWHKCSWNTKINPGDIVIYHSKNNVAAIINKDMTDASKIICEK